MTRNWLAIAMMIALPAAVFWQTRDFEFVWDDEVNVATNPYLNAFTASNVTQLWQKPYDGLYIPMTYTVWAAIAPLARFSTAKDSDKLSPKLYHLANVGFHIANTLIVFAILMIVIQNDWAACAGALLFALHPVQVEPVTWVTGMKDVLCGFFSVIAVWQYLLYSKKRRKAITDGESNTRLTRQARFHYLGATIVFICAMLAKPAAVITPVIVLLLDSLALKRPLRETALPIGGWLLLTIPFVIIAKLSQPESELGFVTPLWARPLIAGDASAFYLYKLFLPLRLAPDYSRSPEFVLQQSLTYFIWLIPFSAAVLIWRGKRRWPWLVAAGGIFLVGSLPVSGLVPFRFQNSSTVADRYLYLAMLGPALALACVLCKRRSATVTLLCFAAIGLFGVISAWQTRHWENEPSLFTHVLEINPRSWAAHYGLGRAFVRQGKKSDAMEHFREAARLQPEFTKAHFSLAGLLVAEGSLGEAIVEYRQALRIAPNYVDARVGLAKALTLQGNLAAGLDEYRRALDLAPGRTDIASAVDDLLTRKGTRAGTN